VQLSIRKILLGSMIAASMAVPAMAEVKVGVIDYARLLDESPQAKAVQAALRDEFGPRYKALVTQEESLKAKNDKLQKDGATMAPDQRTKAEKDLRDSARELDRKKQEWQDDSNAKRNDEMNKLQRSLIGEVREYAKAQLRRRHRGRRHLRDARGGHHAAGAPDAQRARAEAGRRGAGAGARAETLT